MEINDLCATPHQTRTPSRHHSSIATLLKSSDAAWDAFPHGMQAAPSSGPGWLGGEPQVLFLTHSLRDCRIPGAWEEPQREPKTDKKASVTAAGILGPLPSQPLSSDVPTEAHETQLVTALGFRVRRLGFSYFHVFTALLAFL